jgi:DNA gyrase subunit B
MLDKMPVARLFPNIIFVEGRDPDTNVAVEVALTYNNGYTEHIYSYVNNINTIEGRNARSWFPPCFNQGVQKLWRSPEPFERAKVKLKGMISVKG